MVKTPNYDLDIDATLGGSNASDYIIPSQKAIKDYVDNHSGGSSDIDNLSITENSSNKLQTVGVINQNATTTAIKTWTGTKAQYDALKDIAHTMYGWEDYESGILLAYTEALPPNINDPVYDSSYNIIGRVTIIRQSGNDFSINYDGFDFPLSRPVDDDSTRTIYENRIDPNTLYNITDDTDVSLTILEALYPVGSVYITTANTCPLSTLISGSTWELVSSGRVLQGADNNHIAGTTIEAGLPNITGELKTYADLGRSKGTGAIRRQNDGAKFVGTGTTTSGTQYDGFDFDASRSNSIYGNSTTVQPPAYIVNIYRRTA